MSLSDEQLMHIALAEAQAAAQNDEVPVGAVIYDPTAGQVVARAANGPIAQHDPTAHAEICALRLAAKQLQNYRLTGMDLIVTLEPCAMCAGAISHGRIRRLVYGATDPKGGAVEHGPRVFDQPTCHHRPEVISGVMADASAQMLKGFFKVRRK